MAVSNQVQAASFFPPVLWQLKQDRIPQNRAREATLSVDGRSETVQEQQFFRLPNN